MPRVIAQPLIQYEFSDDELVVAAVFTELQTAYIETQLSMAAIEKTNLAYEPGTIDAKDKFLLESEFLRGQVTAFQLLLDGSTDLKEKQRELLARQQASQASF